MAQLKGIGRLYGLLRPTCWPNSTTHTHTHRRHCAAHNQPSKHTHPNAIRLWVICSDFLCPATVLFFLAHSCFSSLHWLIVWKQTIWFKNNPVETTASALNQTCFWLVFFFSQDCFFIWWHYVVFSFDQTK